MTSPMMRVPEHLRIPVTKDGQGPAQGADIDHWACWCPDGADCTADSRIFGLDDNINRRVGNE